MNVTNLKNGDRSTLEFKQYMPLSMKQLIIKGGIEDPESGLIFKCLETKENGMKVVDIFAKEVLVSIILVREYTNIDLQVEDEQEDLIDNILESGIIVDILNEVPDAVRFMEILEEAIDQELEMANALSSVVANGIMKLINKIPKDMDAKWLEKMANKIPKIIDKISPENREIIKGMQVQKK
jgi:hypothetical protein